MLLLTVPWPQQQTGMASEIFVQLGGVSEEGHWGEKRSSIVLDRMPSASGVRAGPFEPVPQRRFQLRKLS